MITTWRGAERRQQKRYRCCGPVKIINPQSQLALPATISDISLSGCALQLRKAQMLDDGARVELNFMTSYFTFRVIGTVRSFVSDQMLVRVSFVQLNQRAWADIVAFIRDQGDDWGRQLQTTSLECKAA